MTEQLMRRILPFLLIAFLTACGGGGGGEDSEGEAVLGNRPPTVNVGADQSVDAGTVVALSGTASDPDGTIATYTWTQTGGVRVLLSGASRATATFTAPDVSANETLTFRLTVTDDDGATSSDDVRVLVRVRQGNRPPTVNVGADQSVDAGTVVTLSGTASDPDGTIATYTWTQTGGVRVLLSGASRATVTFTAPDVSANETLTFRLTVTDDDGASATDMITVTVSVSVSTVPLREMVFDDPAPGKPRYVIAGTNASLQYWANELGEISQVLYESVDGMEIVRIFYDPSTGAATTMLNEVSGHYVSIIEKAPNRVDFWAYDASGLYSVGYAVLQIDDTYFYGEIVGEPAYSGVQINGQLNPATASWTGSFTLRGDSGDEDGLTNIRSLPPGLTTYIDGLVPDTGSGASGPIVAQQTFSLYRGLVTAGAVLVGAGIVAGAPAIAVAGAAGVIAAQILPVLADEVPARLADPCLAASNPIATLCRDIGNMAVNHLATEDDVSLASVLDDTYDWIEEKSDRLRGIIDQGGEYLENISDGLLQNDSIREENPSEPASLLGPTIIANGFSGTAGQQDGTSISVEGSIEPDGTFIATGMDGGDSLEIDGVVDGAGNLINGTFEWGIDNGTIEEQFAANVPYAMCLAAMPPDVRIPSGLTTEHTFIRWKRTNEIIATISYDYEVTITEPPSSSFPSGRSWTHQRDSIPYCNICASSGNFYDAGVAFPCSEFSTHVHEDLHDRNISHDSNEFVYRNFTCAEVFPSTLCEGFEIL